MKAGGKAPVGAVRLINDIVVIDDPSLPFNLFAASLVAVRELLERKPVAATVASAALALSLALSAITYEGDAKQVLRRVPLTWQASKN